MSVSAPVTFEHKSVSSRYLDLLLVIVVAAPALALGAPALGYAVGGGAWIVQRLSAVALEKRIKDLDDQRRRLGISLASAMGRVWFMAIAIMVVGVTVSRPDGLTAALVIFAAFSFTFARSAFAHATRNQEHDH